MREIKYRQPIYCEGKFSYWHYWGDVKGGFLSPVNANLKRDSQRFIERQDKKGKDMYEGDVVDVRMSFKGGSLPHRGEIVYMREFGAFATKNEAGETLLHNHLLNTFEVIGNIYENPELITQLQENKKRK